MGKTAASRRSIRGDGRGDQVAGRSLLTTSLRRKYSTLIELRLGECGEMTNVEAGMRKEAQIRMTKGRAERLAPTWRFMSQFDLCGLAFESDLADVVLAGRDLYLDSPGWKIVDLDLVFLFMPNPELVVTDG